MYWFVIRSITGVQGTQYYLTQSDALAAAKNRTNLSNIPWYVTAVKVE